MSAVLTAQTTIEFQSSGRTAHELRKQGKVGRALRSRPCKGNWQQVYGSQHWLLAMIPVVENQKGLLSSYPGGVLKVLGSKYKW
jgi:hypothetical protein